MKNVMKKAHEITKKIIRKGDSYRATFRLALSFAHSLVKKGVNKMVELKGTEKQVKYANDIRIFLINTIEELKEISILNVEEKWEGYKDSKKEKFGTKENLMAKREERFNKVKETIVNIEDAKIIIENYKNVLTNDKFLQMRNLKEIATREKWNIVSATIQDVQNKNHGKW